MPSSLMSSFASAAAGNNVGNGVNRKDGQSENEWSRGRPNGATQTFRRTSQANTQSRDNPPVTSSTASSGPYIPPHMNPQLGIMRNGVSGDARYNKEQLLGIYQNQKEMRILDRNLSDLFLGPWSPLSRGGSAQTRTDSKDQTPGPEVCWNAQVEDDPLGMTDMTEAERQLFSSSVNSPVKMSQSKEGGTAGVGTRKPSVSNHHGATYNANTGSASRPTTRRRETSESFAASGPLSPTEGKPFFRHEPSTNTPPPALLRRRTDYKDEEVRMENKEPDGRIEAEGEGQTPFGSLRRIATGPTSAGLNGPTQSPWSAGGSRSAFESMGNFGSFAVGAAPASQEARPGFGSARGASRFKDMLTKSSIEDLSPSVKEKTSSSALEKLPEEDAAGGQAKLRDLLKTRPTRSETNPYAETLPREGSAALLQDEQGIEHFGFSEFGHGEHGTQGTPHGRRHHDPTSPANTNPYTSPAANRNEDDDGGDHGAQHGALPPFGAGRRDMFSGSHDRGQPSVFGAARSGLGGLGTIPGWGSAGFGGSTPGRDRSAVSAAFGDPIFSPITDLQSPGGSGLGGGFFGGPAFNSTGRSSRLGGLFPPAMQDQMRSDSRNDAFDTLPDQTAGRDPFESGARRQDGLRALFDDNVGRPSEPPFNAQPGAQSGAASGSAQRASVGPEQTPGHGPSPSGGSSGSNTLPTAQQRQMVMPDRMRWIYRDPQGNVQGPWSGLEMHDWFKAGFFTAELQVKKLEDVEYEPLAQLVRRIGNSREPFLVPQIGVPHGPASATSGNHWATAMSPAGAAPPFANNFPSFGTTLTAEQQNALERRKQEEQYLMARQKEHLAQQQMYLKQMHGPSGGSQGLQHHASAHSLHSQPSFGSMTNPVGYPPSSQAPIQPPQHMHGMGPSSGMPQHPGRDDELPNMVDRMSFNQRVNVPFGTSPIGQQQPIDRARLSGEQQADYRAHEEAFLGRDGRNERLEEFQDLRARTDTDQDHDASIPQPIGAQRPTDGSSMHKRPAPIERPSTFQAAKLEDSNEVLSLTEQVQRTAAANEKAAADKHIEIPPVSISPLPAPTPNRNRQHVADQLAAESRSQSQTPVEPASLAPWAQAEMPKGLSLKEIQAAEAKRAAEQEKTLAAARLAQAEQERIAVASMPTPAPGLPATSNWASSISPASPGPAASVWGAKQAPKPAAGVATKQKTLAQIQKEEESRKLRAVAQAAAQAQVAALIQGTAPAGKRYAELAGKTSPAVAQVPGSPWTTVGASGKVKTPATVIATPQVGRTVSAATMTVPVSKARPVLQTTRTTSISSKSKADEEFNKWAKSQLGSELNSGINVDNFIRDLLMLPAEKEIIREAIYGSSQTLNGERISEEWLRRRKLADKGIVESVADVGSPVLGDTKNSGWNEVAKKGPAKEEPNANAAFKVVSKKKGKK